MKQLLFFLIGWAGFQILGLIVSLFVASVVRASNPGASGDELNQILNGVGPNFAVTGITYLVLGLVLFILILTSHRLKDLGNSFTHWRTLGFAVLGFVVIFVFQLVYSYLADFIFKQAGIKPSSNNNELTLNAMTLYNPALSLLVFGILGPFCEEMTYRVGLFGLLSRLGKALAYIIGALVFGFIHFGFDILFSGDVEAIIVELVNIPNYVVAGLILSFIYDKAGFGASYSVHALNNIFSLILTLIGSEQ